MRRFTAAVGYVEKSSQAKTLEEIVKIRTELIARQLESFMLFMSNAPSDLVQAPSLQAARITWRIILRPLS
jgi:hypothetical protein